MLVLCNSSHPDWCTKKDERAIISFFQKQGRLVELPLPDYGSRCVGVVACQEQCQRNRSPSLGKGRVQGINGGARRCAWLG